MGVVHVKFNINKLNLITFTINIYIKLEFQTGNQIQNKKITRKNIHNILEWYESYSVSVSGISACLFRIVFAVFLK